MKSKSFVIAAVVAVGVAGIARADEQKKEQKYCAAIGAFLKDANELKSIGPKSTVGELRAAEQRVDNDAAKIQKTAHKMKTPTAKEFNAAVSQLNRDVRAIPDNATLEQVHEKINADANNVVSLGEKLASEAGCPVSTQ